MGTYLVDRTISRWHPEPFWVVQNKAFYISGDFSQLQDVLDIRNTINVPISVMGVPAEESPSLGEAAAFPLALRVSQELSARTLPL